MNRFLADRRLAQAVGEAWRCACGTLGCAATAGALVLGPAAHASTPRHAQSPGTAAAPRPDARDVIPPACRQAAAFGDWYTARMCQEAWRAMYGRPKRIKRLRGPERRPDRPDQPAVRQTPRPAAPRPSARPKSPSPKVTIPLAPPPAFATPPAPPGEPQATASDNRSNSLKPLLLLGLLIPAVAGIAYPLRRRIYAAAGAALFAPALSIEEPERVVHFTYRPPVDPFAVLALTGPGAVDTARVVALAALEEYHDTALVVIPRPDASALFGLAEDEQPDEGAPELFVPGDLDAALAYLETELTSRQSGHGSPTRRLLLVADTEKEATRVAALLDRHPSDLSAVLLGDWPKEQITVSSEGLTQVPPTLAGALPERVPAMSRAEARDRLRATLTPRHPTKRRSQASKRN